jgi:hypothetical protein
MKSFDDLPFRAAPNEIPSAFHRPSSYAFAKSLAHVPLAETEILNCSQSMPILIEDGDDGLNVVGMTNPQWSLVNLVGGDGNWLPSYAPIALRTIPFRRAQRSDQRTLEWLDPETLAVPLTRIEALESDGSAGRDWRAVTGLADKLLDGRHYLRRNAEVLAAAGLLRALDLNEPALSGADLPQRPLYTIDQEAFDHLSGERWLGVTGQGAAHLDLAIALQFSQRLLAPEFRRGLPLISELDNRNLTLAPQLPEAFTGMVEFDVKLDGSELIVFDAFESR